MRNFFRHETIKFYPVMFGVILVLWGGWLLLPGSSYNVTAGFSYLRHYVGEDTLGVIAILVGMIQIAATFLNKQLILRTAALIGFYFWLMLSLSFAAGDWHALGVVVYGWFAFMHAFGYVNLKLNGE